MAIPTIRFFASVEVAAIAKESSDPQNRQELAGAGTMQSSLLEAASGAELSQSGRPIKNWQRAQVPTTVLKALTKAGVYPGMRVKVTNPTGPITFFLQLALAQGRGGAEVLPVLWDDNYFSHLAGESREITAQFAARDRGGGKPTLEIGGWYVESNFGCRALAISAKEVKAGQPFPVKSESANTIPGCSRLTINVDGMVRSTQWAFVQKGRKATIASPTTIEAGHYKIEVGGKRIEVPL
jgi:hypothetical protein